MVYHSLCVTVKINVVFTTCMGSLLFVFKASFDQNTVYIQFNKKLNPLRPTIMIKSSHALVPTKSSVRV